MRLGDRFSLRGSYRVQSEARGIRSRLDGHWIEPARGDAENDLVNRHLAAHPLWTGVGTVNLRPALASNREGAFNDHPDILYKLSNFAPQAGTGSMVANIVDVAKASRNWRARRPYLVSLLGLAVTAEAERLIGPIEIVAANEYFMHEAGHCLGYNTDLKYAQGYFRLGGKILWPLVHVEEFRADLLSFGIAVDALSSERAVAVFLYNVLLRLGVHVEADAAGAAAPYGPIPHLLFTVLNEIGWLEAANGKVPLRVSTLCTDDILEVMRLCAWHAQIGLADPELTCATLTDAALVAGRYFRERVSGPAFATFETIAAVAAAGAGAPIPFRAGP